MRLEVRTFRVKDVQFGQETRIRDDGTLELDKQELLEAVLEDPRVEQADLEIARPGESVRVIEYENVIEPKFKAEGGGQPYPGVCGRDTDLVGYGVTNRVANVGVVECLDYSGIPEHSRGESRQWGREKGERSEENGASNVHDRFFDLSGPGAVTPYASLFNVCLVVRPVTGLSAQEQYYASFSNSLKLADWIAELTRDLEPHEAETFDTTPRPDLPGVAYIPHMASTEPVVGSDGTYGSAVYGQPRLSAPWYLRGTELLDGAVAGGGAAAVSGGGSTWVMANSPVVLDLLRRHGKDVNFRGCIVQRTNWTNQKEYIMAAHRATALAEELGIQGAILTTDIRGQRWVGTMLTLQALEQAGIKATMLAEEEDNENGNAPPFIFTPPEFSAAVSTGTGDAGPFPAVSRVIGRIDGAPAEWFGSLQAIHGRYGRAHVRDYYGFGTQSYADFFVPPAAVAP